MLLERALVCNAATVSPDDALNVLGEFGALSFPTFPAVVNRMVLVLRWSYTPDEQGDRTVRAELLDADDDVVQGVEAVLGLHGELPELPAIRRLVSPPVIIEFGNVELPTPGQYRWRVLLDERPAGVVFFNVYDAS